MVRAMAAARHLMSECIFSLSEFIIPSESGQTHRVYLQKADDVVSHSMRGIVRNMVPRAPILKGVQVPGAPGDGQIIVVYAARKAAVLEKADHGYQLVIG